MQLEYEIINEGEVKVSPRGRKSNLDKELLDTLSKLKPGKALRLKTTIGIVDKNQQAGCAAVIRRHFRAISQEPVRIDFSQEGIPQVRLR